MRLICSAIMLLVSVASAQATVPALKAHVNDYADVLTPAEEKSLEDKLAAHEKATTDQIVILTVTTLDGQDIAQFGQEVGETWKIGQKGKDNGVIIIQATKERKLRIQTGRGMEGTLPDARCKQIIREAGPHIKAGDSGKAGEYLVGYNIFTDRIIAAAKAEAPPIAAVAAPAVAGVVAAGLGLWWIAIIFGLIALVVIVVLIVKANAGESDYDTTYASSYPTTYTPSYSPPPPPRKSSSSSSSSDSSSSSSSSSWSSSSWDSGSSSSPSVDSYSGGGGIFDGGGASGDY